MTKSIGEASQSRAAKRVELDAAMKAAGFRFAVIVVDDVTVLMPGACLAYFRIWANAEDAYLAAVNKTYYSVCPSGVYKKIEL